jgi:predicted transcriptional regulator
MPAAMAEQIREAQQKENRTQSELLHEAWRQYFENHYGTYTATKSEIAAIRKGRAEISKGQYKTLQELRDHLDSSHRKARRERARKSLS